MEGLIRFGDTVTISRYRHDNYIILSYKNPFIFLWNVKRRKKDTFIYGNLIRGKCILLEKKIPKSEF
jgi:hypothetical protein